MIHKWIIEFNRIISNTKVRIIGLSNIIFDNNPTTKSSRTLNILSQYLTENSSTMLFDIIENLDETMSDILIDIISSMYICFEFNLGSNSQYSNLQNITHLLQLITESLLSNNVSIINEKIHWNSCWMNIDLSNVEINNTSIYNGYSSNKICK